MNDPTPSPPRLGPLPAPGDRTPLEKHPPRQTVGCLTLIVGTLALLVVAAFVFVSMTFRPFPSPPPTGVLETRVSQPVRIGPTDQVAEIELTLSLSGQMPGGNRSTSWPGNRAPVVVRARLTGPDGTSADAADMTIEKLEPASSYAADVDPLAMAETGVVDALRWSEPCDERVDCIRRYRIAVTRHGRKGEALELALSLTGRLEYPINVPRPDGAALGLTVASSSAAAQAMLIQATETETITLQPGAPTVVRDLTVVYPADDGRPARLRGLRLRVELAPIGRPSPQPTSPGGRPVTAPPGRVTLIGAGAGADAEPILVRDLTGGSLDVRLAPFGGCGSQETCSISVRAIFEILDPRPDASYRLRWSAEGRQAGSGASQALRISVRPAVPVEVARAEGSGELTLTRKAPSATGTALVVMVRQTGQPAASAASGTGHDLQAVATVTVTTEASGGTRRAPVIVTIGPSFQENGEPAVVAARAGGGPATAIFRPLRSCRIDQVQCEEGYRIDAVLAPSAAAIITSAETITVHWHMTVTLGRLGSAPSPDEQPPMLVIE